MQSSLSLSSLSLSSFPSAEDKSTQVDPGPGPASPIFGGIGLWGRLDGLASTGRLGR